MRLLLDTHLLIWAANDSERLTKSMADAISDPKDQLVFSMASLWEMSIKASLRRRDFQFNPGHMRQLMLENGYEELSIVPRHVFGLLDLPHMHADPFDRLLIAQANAEGITLLTADPVVARYPGPIRLVA